MEPAWRSWETPSNRGRGGGNASPTKRKKTFRRRWEKGERMKRGGQSSRQETELLGRSDRLKENFRCPAKCSVHVDHAPKKRQTEGKSRAALCSRQICAPPWGNLEKAQDQEGRAGSSAGGVFARYAFKREKKASEKTGRRSAADRKAGLEKHERTFFQFQGPLEPQEKFRRAAEQKGRHCPAREGKDRLLLIRKGARGEKEDRWRGERKGVGG